MMEDGVRNWFTKLFTICTPNKNVLTILEFRKSGEPITKSIQRSRGRVSDSSLLVVYDPYSKHFHNLEINGRDPYSVYAYMETLLLLDQPDFIIYNKDKTLHSSARSQEQKLLKHRRRA
ncbi:hypothetical protein Hanom_Chr15g01412891 [Helianthus anomalus]